MARLRHGDDIVPVQSRKTLPECITIEMDKLVLWYNDKDGSTRICAIKNPNQQPN